MALVACQMARSVVRAARLPPCAGLSAAWMSSRPVEPAKAAVGDRKKVTLLDLQRMRDEGEKIVMVTAYDYPSAMLAERAGLDMVLVGDSLAMVVLGHTNTTSVTMDEMLHHSRAVARGARTPFVVSDMPFGSYHASTEDAIRNAVRFIHESHVEAVKLEGGRDMAPTVKAITRVGVPVVAHIGLTPQRVAALGGYRVQGKSVQSALDLVDDAVALQDAGASAIVLECIPPPVANAITQAVSVPTIGIGAGAGCSGQVLVMHDMLGLYDRFVPKFCKQYAKLDESIVTAFQRYKDEVKSGLFPQPEHTYAMKPETVAQFVEALGRHRKMA